MRRAAIALSLTVLLLAAAAVSVRAQTPGNPAAIALVQKALDASNIEARGSPPFQMEARIQVQLGPGQTENGKLAWIWTPVGWWHDELTLGGYRSVEMSGGQQIWMTDTTDYLPFPVFLTQEALNVLDWLREARGQALSAPQTSVTGETCVETLTVANRLRYCFDPNSGNLRRVIDSAWNMTFWYSDYTKFGTKSFPRLMQVTPGDEGDFVEVRIVQLDHVDQPDLRLFLPVKGARELPTVAQCGTIEPAKLKKLVRPVYPRQAQDAGISGIVKLYAEVGEDGVPRGMWPLNSAAPILTRAAIDAVKHWRYRPRTCKKDGTRLRQIETVTLVFRSP
jgi:hypothetical protein